METEQYFTCRGKSICGVVHKLSVRLGMLIIVHITKQRKLEKQMKKKLKQMMKKVDANDAHSIYMLDSFHYHGYLGLGLLQDREIVQELWTQAAKQGSSREHFGLGDIYEEGGDM